MERYRLKNIIILILALLNAFLLAALSIRGSGARTARRTQQQELVALFAADGMELDPALIPEDTAVSVYTLTRDEALEKKVAAYLLGETPEGASQGGGIYTYSTARGAAIFRDIGSFDAARDALSGQRRGFLPGFLRGIFLLRAGVYAGRYRQRDRRRRAAVEPRTCFQWLYYLYH